MFLQYQIFIKKLGYNCIYFKLENKIKFMRTKTSVKFAKIKIFRLKYMLNVSLLQFYFLNSNGSIFYILIIVIINYLTEIMQRTNIKLIIINF